MIALWLAATVTLPFICEGKDFYVSTNGNDQAAGSLEKPFATLERAGKSVAPGDTVFVRGGVYRLSNGPVGVELPKSGRPGALITYRAYKNEKPVFDGSDLRGRGRPCGIKISGDWVRFKGFEVCNVPAPKGTSYGVWLLDVHDCVLEELVLHDNQGPGLFIDGGTGGHLILNCDSFNNYDPNSRNGDGQNADGFGCHYQARGAVTTFRGCRAWWNSDDGYDWFKQEVPVLIENCWAMGAGYKPNGGPPAPDGNGAGFKMGNSFTGVRHTIRNCVSIKNKAQGFYANHSHGGSDWYNNTAFNNHGPGFDMLSDLTLSGTNVHRLRNNASYPSRVRAMNDADSKNNSWDLKLELKAEDFLSVSDAGFTGPRQSNGGLPDLQFLKPRKGGQLIDRGVDVGLPFHGAAPDLGAYESPE